MTRYAIHIIALLMVGAMALTGCRERQEIDGEQTLSLSICLPMEETYTSARQPQRVMGDPGTTERFLLPEHIYFFVLKKTGESWTVWHAIHKTPEAEDWVKKSYVGLLQSTGDTIYEYTPHVNLLLEKQKFDGMVFAIASPIELTFNRALNTLESLDDVLNLRFATSGSTVQQNLQNIYSSPYNYIVNGNYYGAFSSLYQKVPHVQLMLYHIAAKVDLKWNVAEDKRIDRDVPGNGVRLTYLEARRLYNGMAYCFQPMRNTMASLPLSGGYDIPDIVTPADEGLWWEGRTYFYTIPYTVSGAPDYFPLQLLMRTNGSTGTGYQLTLNQPIDTSDVFVPWIRGNFSFTQPLTDRSETKTIDN